MNAEIYSFRTPSRPAGFNEDLDNVIAEMKKNDINVIYKTELSEYEDKITDAVKQSSTDSGKIKMIIMVNALDKDASGVVYDTINKFSAQETALRTNKIGGYFKEEETSDGDSLLNSCPYENGPVALCEFSEGCECYMIKHRGMIILALPKMSLCNTPLDEMVSSAASKALTLDNTYGNVWDENLFEDDMSDVLAAVIADSKRGSESEQSNGNKHRSKAKRVKKEKKPIYMRILPWKGDGAGEAVRKIILIVAVFGFVFCGVKLLRLSFIDKTINDIRLNELRDLYSAGWRLESDEEEPEGEENSTADGKIKARWREIYARYPKLVGWINIAFSKWVDLPVFMPPANDPNYYLYRDYDGRDNRYGSLFVDTRSAAGVNSKNIIIHGHHMNDGSMFANVTQYQYMDYYKQDPAFTFDTIYSDAKWKVIAVFKTNTLSEHGAFFNYLRGEFNSDSDFLNYVYQVRARSIITTPVDVNEHDQLVTLSTCSYEFKDFRTVVVARRVRKGESAKVDVSQAYYTSNPLYPDVWYRYNSGTKPTVTSFEDAYSNGKISWYDGKGRVIKTRTGYAFIPDRESEDITSSSTSSSQASSVPTVSIGDTSSKITVSVDIGGETSYYIPDDEPSSEGTATQYEDDRPSSSKAESSRPASSSSKPESKPSEAPKPPSSATETSSEESSEEPEPISSEEPEPVSSEEPPEEPSEPDEPSSEEPSEPEEEPGGE